MKDFALLQAQIFFADSEKDEIRFFFIIEQAHWFYLDFYCAESDKLQPCGIKQFAYNILNHIPAFKKYLNSVDKILDEWRKYKSSVPTYGAMWVLKVKHLNMVLSIPFLFYFQLVNWRSQPHLVGPIILREKFMGVP